MTDRSPPTRVANHVEESNHDSSEDRNHDSENADTDTNGSRIDPEMLAYWQRTCAALPPMSEDAIERAAMVLRRISRRTGR